MTNVNKVKLRGQKIPGINMARKVFFLRISFYTQRQGKGNRKREKNKPNSLLLHRVHLANEPAPPGRILMETPLAK